MKKTLQDQYSLIIEGKGHKGVFLTEAKRQFPNIIRNAATFEEASRALKDKNIISENIVGIRPINAFEPTKKQQYEVDFAKFLEEAKYPEIKAKEVKAKTVKSQEDDEKAELKTTSKQVEADLEHGYDQKDDKNIDNLIFDQVMTGYYAEMKDPKNADKTMEQLKDIVLKNLAKDPIFYTKDGQFGVKGLGYTTEAPGLGTPKEAKGKYKSSGYGDLNEQKIRKAIRTIVNEELNTEVIGKNYPDKISGEYEGKSVLFPGADLYDLLNDTLEVAISEDDFINKVAYALTDETSNLSSQDEHKLRIWYKKNGGVSIDEIININTKNTKGGGGRRYIPTEVFMPQSIIDKFNFTNPGENAPSRPESMQVPHIKFGTMQGNTVMLISDFLFNALNNLERGRTSREKEVGKSELEKLVSILDPMARGMIKKKVESKLAMGNYHVVNMPIEREKGVGVKIPLGKEELEELMLREFVGDTIRQELNEGVEKELAAINKEAEHEIIASKLEKVQALMDKKQAQLGKLDEDEDMKALTDKKKVKEIEKDIKALEKAKAKLEKLMGKGKSKGVKKEVIDETEDEDFDIESYEDEDEDLYASPNMDDIESGNTY
jgi:hypothetical protein